MKGTTVIAHPPNQPLSIVRQWQVDVFGEHVTAALCSYFEYWHTIKLNSVEKFSKKMSQMRPDSEQDISLLQYHTEEEIVQGILLAGGRHKVRKGIKQLKDLGIIEIFKNPIKKMAFDRTRFFLFHPEKVQDLICEWAERQARQPSDENASPKDLSETPKDLSKDLSQDPKDLSEDPNFSHQAKTPDRGLKKPDHQVFSNSHTEITNNRFLSEKKPPLPPSEGGDAHVSKNIEETAGEETTGNKQALTVNKEQENSGESQKGKRCRAAKSKNSSEILAQVSPELQARFNKFWDGYSTFATQRGSRSGSKKRAAAAWVELVKTDFQGLGLEGFEKGVRAFLKLQGDNTAGIPHACRFLFSKRNQSGSWQDALDQLSASGSISGLAAGVSDRGNAPPVFEAPVEEFKSSPPTETYKKLKAQAAVILANAQAAREKKAAEARRNYV